MTDASPRVEGREPVFSHVDDDSVPWLRVKAQRNADGSESYITEKFLARSTEPQYLAIYAKYDPGMITRRHGHRSPHTVLVLEGSLAVGGHPCPPGTHVELPLGAAFGPIIAGPEGATLYEVMMGDPTSWADQPELYEETLAEHGAEKLPDPHVDPTHIGQRQ